MSLSMDFIREKFFSLDDETKGFIILANHAFGAVLKRDKDGGMIPMMEYLIDIFKNHSRNDGVRIVAHAFATDEVYFIPWKMDKPDGWILLGTGIDDANEEINVEYYGSPSGEGIVAVPKASELVSQIKKHNERAVRDFKTVVTISEAILEHETKLGGDEQDQDPDMSLLYRQPTTLN